MFRKININNNDEDIKIYLYRNRREGLAEIPKECITKITRTLGDIDTVELSIPKYKMIKGKKVINNLYNKIQPKMQIIVECKVGNEIVKERYTLLNKSRSNNKNKGDKTFTAQSFEYTLKTKKVSLNSSVVQLKTDEVHIAKGIMDLFEEQTGWTIDYVDPKSRVETSQIIDSVNVTLFENYRKENITENSLIFEADVLTEIKDDKALYVDISYGNLRTYDENNKLLKTENIINTISDALPKNIKHIKAYHHSEVGNRYGIRYVFTTVDNVEIEKTTTFTNIIDKSITAENIIFRWETGEYITKENVKYINLDDTENDNWYAFLRDIESQFKSMFIFDSYNKTIGVIHEDNIGKEAPYLLSYDTNIIDINVDEQSEYVNCLKVVGKDGLSIAEENIYGNEKLYNFDWYRENGIMSDELQSSWDRYEEILTIRQEDWLNIKNLKMSLIQRKTAIDSEIKSLEERVKATRNLLAGYMAGNDEVNQARIKAELDALEESLNSNMAKRTEMVNQITIYEDEMMEISTGIQMENATDLQGNKIFTDVDLEEINDMLVEEVYEDDYYSTSYGLINNSKLILSEKIKPDVDFKLNVENLCKIIKHPLGWSFIVQLGDVFQIDNEEIIKDIGENKIRLCSYEYYPSEDKISSLTFTNKTKKNDYTKSFANIGKKSNATTNVVNSYRQIWEDSLLTNNFCKNMIEGTLDAAATSVRGRTSENLIDISSAGIFLYDSRDTNKAIYIGSSLICLTEDGFATSKVAINSTSVVADVVMGKLFLGNKLMITNDNASFTIEGNGLTIYDEGSRERIFLGLEEVDGVEKARLRLYGKDGKGLVISEDGLISHNTLIFADDLDPTHPMEFDYVVQDGTQEIRECKLILAMKPYRMTVKSTQSGGKLQTSSNGGGFSISKSSESGGYYRTTSVVSSDAEHWWTPSIDNTVDIDKNKQGFYYLKLGYLKHNHTSEYTVEVPAHHHNFSVSQDAHSHSIDWTHNHELVAGIFESTAPTNCSIYINGSLVVSNVSYDTSIDITKHLKVGVNKIKITSARLGRIQSTIYSKSFVAY